MPTGNGNSDSGVVRRRILQSLGVAGAAGLAGCFGDDDDDDSGNGNGNGSDGGDISFPLDVQLEVNADNDDRVAMVELIAESMEQSGYFDVEIETYEWNQYVGRVLDTEYADNGHIPTIGLSGTFNPHSFCDALHNSANHGACCNLTGINDSELDDLLDSARFGVDVAEDPQLRAERYDEIWQILAEEAYSSITHFDLATAVRRNNVHGYAMWPFNEGVFSYAMYAPQDEQVMWVDDSSDPRDTDLSDLEEGGTLTGGLAANIDSFDPPHSSDTTSTMAQNFIFETLTANDSEGNIYPWLAEDYELLETQDVERDAYEEYMISVEAGEEGALPVEDQIIVRHPEDFPAEEGDEVRILTVNETGDAVDDGVFGMHFRYDLEEGVEFHNGDEMTSEDVVASYERYENSQVGPQTYDSVLHVEAVDEYTVDVYAQVPDAEGERELPGVYILHRDQADLPDGAIDPRPDDGEIPIGTGPYEYDDFSDEQYLELVKNDNYWIDNMGIDQKSWFDGPSEFPDGPVIERFDLEIIPEDPTRSAALQNEEVDLTYGLAAATLDDFDASDDFIVDGVETGGYEYIQYPVRVEPWDDQRLRRAVNHLVPRQTIVDQVLSGWARPAWTSVPELAHGSGTVDHDALEDELRPLNEYDPEEAGNLIEEMAEDRGYDIS